MIEIKSGFGREQLPLELVKAGMLFGAEIGVQSGEHAEMLLVSGVQRLHLIDSWSQQKNYFDIANVHDAHHAQNLRHTLNRMAAFPFRVTIHSALSHDAAQAIEDASLDFIYIDANHNLESVRLDLASWVPKVRSGGWICGHDFLDSGNCCGSEFGVKTAVTEFCEASGIQELFVCPDESFPNWSFVK